MIVSLDAPIFRFLYVVALVLLVGSGLYARYLEPRAAAPFKRLPLIGAALLIAASLLDVGFTAWRALGDLSPYLYGAYLTRTWNGQWVILRVIVALPLAWLGVQPRPELQLLPRVALGLDRGLQGLLAVLICLTLSMTGHAGARGELLPIVSDLIHLLAMLVWVSAVLYTALFRFTNPRDGVNVLGRVSSLAMIAVGVMALTGVYAALVRLWAPELLSLTQYGQTLLLKLGLVSVTLVLAGINRFQWMPLLQRLPSRFPQFQRFLLLEATVLTAVLVCTSALTTTAPPERGAGLKEIIRFHQQKGDLSVQGTGSPTALGGVHLEFSITDKSGAKLPASARVEVTLDMTSHGMNAFALPVTRLKDGQYSADGFFGMTGDFAALIRTADTTWQIALPSR